MRYILNSVIPKTAILQVRAAQSCDRKDIPIGEIKIIEFEGGILFECYRNEKSISVWPL